MYLSLILVFIGGGLGSLARYGLNILFSPYSVHFPWATFLINLISCVLLGFLFIKLDLSENKQAVLWMTGFCGGFSTFSTFTMENYKLFQAENWILLGAYIALSVIVCLFGFIIGVKMA